MTIRSRQDILSQLQNSRELLSTMLASVAGRQDWKLAIWLEHDREHLQEVTQNLVILEQQSQF